MSTFDRPVHHRIDTFDTLEWALRWADPWQERIWEEAGDADETGRLDIAGKEGGGAVSPSIRHRAQV